MSYVSLMAMKFGGEPIDFGNTNCGKRFRFKTRLMQKDM